MKEKSRRGQCQYDIKTAAAACEMVMRKFSASTLQGPNTRLSATLIPGGAASFKLLDCPSGSAMYVDLLGAAGRINVGRPLQEALIKEAMSAGCFVRFLRSLRSAFRFFRFWYRTSAHTTPGLLTYSNLKDTELLQNTRKGQST